MNDLARARETLTKAHKVLKVSGAGYANVRCPIMGNQIDPAKVSEDLTRKHKGTHVAFCCGGCPARWDKLSAEEKAAKLQVAVPGGEDTPDGESADAGVVNQRCPIMGSKLDRDDVPDKLTRTFHGRKVGFCCGGCPGAWDSLSMEQKQQRLKKAME